MNFLFTVELHSKGPGRKGNPPIRERISGPGNHFLILFFIGYKGISVFGKNHFSPMKSLGAKFHCMWGYHRSAWLHTLSSTQAHRRVITRVWLYESGWTGCMLIACMHANEIIWELLHAHACTQGKRLWTLKKNKGVGPHCSLHQKYFFVWES